MAALTLLFGAGALPAHAETVAYELDGNWVEQPESVVSGLDVLGAVWKFDINDDRPAPSNDPVPNNVLTVKVENAKLTKTPSTCLTTSPDAAGNEVVPLSSLSADSTTLVCNLGTRDQGTAELALTGVVANGATGDLVGASAQFRTLTKDLPKIPILATFAMDAKFDKGTPLSQVGSPTANQFITFPFSLSHQEGSSAGPASVSFDLTVAATSTSEVSLRSGESCVPIDRRQPEYPFSGGGFPTDQTAKFPTCVLEKIGPDTFRLTLSNLDYTSAGPRLESNGQPLPLGMKVIAAGDMLFQLPWTSVPNRWQVSLTASAPTYIAADGSEYRDDVANNSNSVPVIRGFWTGAWTLSSQLPEGFGGAGWSDTFRAPAGATVMSMGGVKVPSSAQVSDNWVCKTLDTEFVEFEGARVGTKATNPYYDTSYAGDIWYYTGEFVSPISGDPVDPNLFECGTIAQKGNPAVGNQAGWSTELPADLSTVKAVKLQVTSEMGPSVTIANGLVYLVIDQKIKQSAPLGQDVWSWTSILTEGDRDWQWDPNAEAQQHRTLEVKTPAQAAPGVPTAGSRYPYTGAGRDVIRVVGSLPLVQKDVQQKEYGPGTVADYQLRFGLETVLANPSSAQVVVTDTLPLGMSYVAGSAETEPAITTIPNGRQQLVWTFDAVQPNQELQVINFKATVPVDASPGATYENVVTAASQGNTRRAVAEFIIPDTGYTVLSKETRDPVVTLVDGSAKNVWTVTLESHDPNISETTDIIDILPFVGDGRGSSFSGTLKLDGEVEAPQGATVYYTVTPAATLNEDPKHASNGGFATPSDIWSTTYDANATAIRVVGGDLRFRDVETVSIPVAIEGAAEGDAYVNTAVGRASSPEMRMRTSALFTTAVTPALSWSKVGVESDTEFLAGSEWELVGVTGDGGEPLDDGEPITVVDCVSLDSADCSQADSDHRAGHFTVTGLTDGWYRLTETVAPDGYTLDPTPHFVLVEGHVTVATPFVNVPTPKPTPTPPSVVPEDPPGDLAVTGGPSSGAVALFAGALLAAGAVLFLRRRSTTQ